MRTHWLCLLGLIIVAPTFAATSTPAAARTASAEPLARPAPAKICREARLLVRAAWQHRGYVATAEESRIIVEAMDGDITAVRKGLRTLPAKDIPRWRQLAMFDAAFAGQPATVAALLRDGAKPNASSSRPPYTATFYQAGVRTMQSTVGVKTVDGFKAMGLMKNDQVETGPAILMAIRCDSLPVVRVLLERGANPNVRPLPDSPEDPLVEAIFGGDPRMVRLLIDQGADPCMDDRWSAARWNAEQRRSPAPTMASMGRKVGLPVTVINRLTCGAAPPSSN